MCTPLRSPLSGACCLRGSAIALQAPAKAPWYQADAGGTSRGRSIGGADHLHPPNHLRRRLVEPPDQGLHIVAADEIHLDPDAIAFGYELRIVHRVRETSPQRGDDPRISSRRRDQWTPHGLPRKDEFKHMAVLRPTHQLENRGNIRKIAVLLGPKLHDDLELAAVD